MNGKITHYYDFSRVRSYGARYLMIVGSRGTGKTYGAKKIAISNAIKKGEQFIYLRRHRVEQKGRFTFFDDIAHEFPGYEFAVRGNDAVMRMEGDKKWDTIGYFSVLSTSQAQKSTAYPLVTTVIFDEFIIENPQIRYLDDEVRVFNNFYLTVDRYKDETTVFMLSNSASIMTRTCSNGTCALTRSSSRPVTGSSSAISQMTLSSRTTLLTRGSVSLS